MRGQQMPELGEKASLNILLTENHVDQFIKIFGDDNPLHVDDEFARALGFPRRVVHGMCYAAFLSKLIGTKLPGPGSLWAAQTYRFISPVFVGEDIKLSVIVVDVFQATKTIRLDVKAEAADGRIVMEGESTVLLPGVEFAQVKPKDKYEDKKEKRVALLVGASGGLGSAIVNQLVKDGFSVALCGRNFENNLSQEKHLKEAGVKAIATPLDLRDTNSVKEAYKKIQGTIGTPTVVIHAASETLPNRSIDSTDWDTFSDHFEIQAGGLYRLLQSAAPGMMKKGSGLFIYIASTAIHGTPAKNMGAYAVAKAAGAQLVKSIALELAPYGIRGNIISPGFLETGLTAGTSDKLRKLVAVQSPLRRLADIKEISNVVGFLSSDNSSYINGHDIIIDGGTTML